ncbi:TPA: DUF5082 family protein [Streptococcus equi subsp. zooepidemicus]
MGQVDYNHINQLQRQVDQHRASLSTATAEIASIDEKLERLRCAKASVGAIQGDVHQIKVSVMAKRDQPDWKGERKDRLMSSWEEFSHDYRHFQLELDAYYDAICDTITCLENQKYEQQGLIGWCQSMINSLGNEIEKLFHIREG